ncbi:MAG: ABC transporter substrate-binding protein [Candidatus Bathyarchaeota archaeon]|nr:ABC transporter substrate-binding protein [Candidatus Bathyarchaeota archaeon]
MKSKSAILLIILLVSLTLVATVPMVSAQVYGPQMDYLRITNYLTDWKEFSALEADEIDITDWYLTKTYVDKFAANPKIVMDEFSDVGSYEYDINNQKWPTGCDGLHPHTRQRPETGPGDGNPPSPGADWDPETDSWKVYFDPNCEWCIRSWGFRLALAYLTDRDYIRTEILKGFGVMLPTWLTAPQLGWADMNNLTTSSFTYEGPNGDVFIPSLVYKRDVNKAKELLDAAGFTLGTDGKTRIDPRTGTYLSPLLFWIRLDHPHRRDAGLKLAADMKTIGIPADAKVVEKTVCYKAAMIEYNYHIYTGGYSYGVDPWEIMQGLFHSNQYWAPVGWSGGYQGFCNLQFDVEANKVKNGATRDVIEDGVHKGTYIMNKYVCSIPLWSTSGAEAYRKGWDGVVNHEGYCITWGTGGVYYWSLFNMRPTTGGPYEGSDTIRLGIKSSPEALSVVSSEWVWDWIILDTIYETLLVRNPYNLAEDRGMLAASWTTETWDTNKIAVTYTLKTNVKWHDGTTLTPEDVKWGLEFIRECGPGVAWNYMMAKDIDHVNIKADEPALGDLDVKVYFKTGSYWAAHLAGFLEFPSRKIWMAANTAFGWGYDPTKEPTYGQDYGPGKRFSSKANALKVREYKPKDDDVYRADTGGVGSDGIVDLAQDGTGPWVFVDVAGIWEFIDLVAFRPGIPETPWQTSQHHLSQAEVEQYLEKAFWSVGDTNRDRVVDISDMQVIARSLGTNSTWTPGTDWNQYNVDADLNGDNKVTVSDLGMAGRTYGKSGG